MKHVKSFPSVFVKSLKRMVEYDRSSLHYYYEEERRILPMQYCPRFNHPSEELARNGFIIYDDDTYICVFCESRFTLSYDYDIVRVHVELNPDCKLYKKKSENIPLDDELFRIDVDRFKELKKQVASEKSVEYKVRVLRKRCVGVNK